MWFEDRDGKAVEASVDGERDLKLKLECKERSCGKGIGDAVRGG